MYSVFLANAFGAKIAPLIDVVSLSWVQTIGDVGLVALRASRQPAQIGADYRLSIYRRGQNSARRVVVSMARAWSFSEDEDQEFAFAGEDANTLLNRRIVAYAAESAQAKKTGAPDDLMKDIVAENLGASATDSDRDLSSYLSIAADLTEGTSLSMGFSWRRVLDVLQDLQAASKADGTEILFAVEPRANAFAFRTRATFLNSDRSAGARQIIFSLSRGNLVDPVLTSDFRDASSFVYAGGRGREADRNIQTASDSAQIALSPFGRSELFVNANATTDATLTAEAKSELERRRARRVFTGTIIATPQTPYGAPQGFELGDRVSIQYAGKTFNALVRSVSGALNSKGIERISARVEGEIE